VIDESGAPFTRDKVGFLDSRWQARQKIGLLTDGKLGGVVPEETAQVAKWAWVRMASPAGLEPAACGLGNRKATSVTSDMSVTYGASVGHGALPGARPSVRAWLLLAACGIDSDATGVDRAPILYCQFTIVTVT
jgi:hypothetical protein